MQKIINYLYSIFCDKKKSEGDNMGLINEHMILRNIEELKILAARSCIHTIKQQGIFADIHDTEFKVFSQFGDDGIIQYLIHTIDIPHHSFIEFGVENYMESNTRFLLMNNNWNGLVIDAGKDNIEFIRNHEIYWKHELSAVEQFITKENINTIISDSGFSGNAGILSIDVDGNDYWIWESVHAVTPVVVIIEFNSVFGPDFAVTIPYSSDFNRTKSHYTNLYWGCSLKALCFLAGKKGYFFIGCNSSGNNAYFIRKDKIGRLKPLAVAEGYIESRFRESRDPDGKLTHITGIKRLAAIKDMVVVDIENGAHVKIKDLYGLK
jgi:hypothetical protein